jgi:hypothetical protein
MSCTLAAQISGLSGRLNLRLNRIVLRSGLQRTGVHAEHCKQRLAAAIGQENAKGEGGKYSTGKT